LRKLRVLMLALTLAGWSNAAEAVRAPRTRNRAHQTSVGTVYPPDGFVSAVPIRLTGVSCSGPVGIATLTMATNPFVVGQWIAVRDVSPSAPIVVTGEKVATGDGSTTTFTLRTVNYPIQHGSITILVGGLPQGTDTPGTPAAGVGTLHGRGMGTFRGTVMISGGTAVTLTSTPAVFDSRWQAFVPAIAGASGRYVIGNSIDSTHLKLMAPASDGAGQSFTLSSQVNYVTGVIEVTFTSAPGAGAPITINYAAEPSQWYGERKVESSTSKTVSYAEANCTGPSATASGGTAYAIPVIYVAPASHTRCAYDGDGGQPCTPSDANPGTTKARPKATLAGVLQAVNRHVLTVPYLIQLADANGTGLGGSTPATDCYQPDELTFTGVMMGGSPVDPEEWVRVDKYPESYFWFHGNTHNPGNVLLNGSGTCSSSSRAIRPPEALRFDHTVARLDGFSIQGYGNHVRPGIGPSAITFVNFATGYVENMICTGAGDLDSSSFSQCIGAWDHSTLKVGGNHTVRNANWVLAVNDSYLVTTDPVNGPTQNTNLNYSSSAQTIAIGCSIVSNCQIDHLTATFSGSGRFTAQSATEKSVLYYAERSAGSQCPNAACMDITINAPNMTWESSQLGGHIDSTCGNYQQGVCTVISGPAIRAYAQEDSFIKEYSQSVIAGPDVQVAGGCVEVWNAGWETIPGSQPPTCSSLAIKSESKSFVPLTLQNASGSNTDLLDLKTGAGELAASFNSSGQISRINGLATAGNGVGVEVYSTVSPATDASIHATTMLTPSADANFAARFYVTQVDAGSGCTVATKVAVNLIYTDPYSGGAQPFTFVVPLNTSGGPSASPALSLSTDTITVANVATGAVFFRAKGSTDIQYSTTYINGTCTTQPRYRIVAGLEWF